MGGSTYGITFARKLREQGKYEEALDAANTAIAKRTDDPEAMYDRAATLYCMERFEPAVEAFARAISLDAEANELEEGVLDDDLFEALRKWAVAEPARCREILGRYHALL